MPHVEVTGRGVGTSKSLGRTVKLDPKQRKQRTVTKEDLKAKQKRIEKRRKKKGYK